ncbi:TPA: hypothetical protein HH703_005086 [Escherichia coli]|nr:hypothetical protein [Escherichia coli]HAH5420373.1 hypothetical protein [Escherichia coli]
MFFAYFTCCLSMYIRSAFIMPMKLVKKNPRSRGRFGKRNYCTLGAFFNRCG